MNIVYADCPKIAIENPVGIVQKWWRKPDQIIHPYQFGHNIRKATCLWLKGLNVLEYDTKSIEPKPVYIDGVTGRNRHWVDSIPGGNNEKRRKIRSKTFPGIARAMAEQWG